MLYSVMYTECIFLSQQEYSPILSDFLSSREVELTLSVSLLEVCMPDKPLPKPKTNNLRSNYSRQIYDHKKWLCLFIHVLWSWLQVLLYCVAPSIATSTSTSTKKTKIIIVSARSQGMTEVKKLFFVIESISNNYDQSNRSVKIMTFLWNFCF